MLRTEGFRTHARARAHADECLTWNVIYQQTENIRWLEIAPQKAIYKKSEELSAEKIKTEGGPG